MYMVVVDTVTHLTIHMVTFQGQHLIGVDHNQIVITKTLMPITINLIVHGDQVDLEHSLVPEEQVVVMV